MGLGWPADLQVACVGADRAVARRRTREAAQLAALVRGRGRGRRRGRGRGKGRGRGRGRVRGRG